MEKLSSRPVQRRPYARKFARQGEIATAIHPSAIESVESMQHFHQKQQTRMATR
jgi:hypothetical protein